MIFGLETLNNVRVQLSNGLILFNSQQKNSASRNDSRSMKSFAVRGKSFPAVAETAIGVGM